MQLIRMLAASRPDLIAFRDPAVATQIALRSLARRILELGDEIAELDEPIGDLVQELAPRMLERVGFGSANSTSKSSASTPGSDATFAGIATS